MGEQQSLVDLERARLGGFEPDRPYIPEGLGITLPEDMGGLTDPLENPKAVAQASELANPSSSSKESFPVISDPPDGAVKLAQGLRVGEHTYFDAEVKELTGEDEEYITRAVLGGDFARLSQAVLERGVLSIGTVFPTPAQLDELLIGDREELLLGIRIATYGNELKMKVICAHCQVESDIIVDLAAEIEHVPLKWDSNVWMHKVKLHKLGEATVRITTGADQRAIAGLENKTTSELNTELLSRLVLDIGGVPVKGSKEKMKSLPIRDRETLLEFIIENQPGPDYGKLKNECTVCGRETLLGLAAERLFPWLS